MAPSRAPAEVPAAPPLPPTPLQRVLTRSRSRRTAAMLGPAFVAAIAYVDPGNFATNVSAGAKFGYALLWVVLLANLMAMVIQYLSAKLGVVTGRNLAEQCRDRFPRPVTWGLWVQAELIAMSTDIAEIVGAAIALNLLFDVPLLAGGAIAGMVAFALLGLQSRGYRYYELVIAALPGIILLGFLYQLLAIGPSAEGAVAGLVPSFASRESGLLAVGIVGATVMPHAIYLHSALTQGRIPRANDEERRQTLRFMRFDIAVALGLAGLINMTMLAVAAKLFHSGGTTQIETLEQAHAGFGTLVGGGAALAFAVALLASGASSSSVGTYAGQVVMQGFVTFRIPLMVRRAVTLTPALIILALGVSPTAALVISQVVLSFGIPFALVPLVLLTADRKVMGVHVNRRGLTVLASILVTLISALNVFLLQQQLFG